MRNMKRVLMALLVLALTLSCLMSISASAATSLPDSVYLYPTMGGETCTLVSAAMMHRARMYLSGNSAWSTITEYSIYDIAWISGTGLRASWTYNINGNTMSVSRTGVSGISIATLKAILDSHPEGIVLYSGSLYHAVFVTDYEGDTFYCADPYGGSYSGHRMTLASSYLGRLAGGTQSAVLSNVTAYWYISGYSISNDSGTLVNLGDSFYGSISRTDAPGELLSVVDADDGTTTFTAAADQSAQQRWFFLRQDDGSYKIQSARSGYLLNVHNGDSAEGNIATVWLDLGNNHQRWYIYDMGDGYRITAKSTQKSLSLNSANSGECAALYSYSGTAAQTLNIHIHSYDPVVTAPSCTQQGYTTHICSCGDYYVDSYTEGSEHSYGDWYVTTAPTCETDGIMRRDCVNCGDYETSSIVAAGHSYTSMMTASTCTEQGYTTHTCSMCGDSYTDSYTAANGHIFGTWCVDTSATCDTDGAIRRDCAICDHFETIIIVATGHKYASTVTAPTCMEQGYTAYTCFNCHDSYTDSYTSALGHSYVNHICTNCGRSDAKLDAPEVTVSNVSSTGKIKLSWNKVDGAAKYKVYRATSKNGTYSLLKTTTGTSLTNTSAKAGKTYYYYVVAVDGAGNTSDKSNIVNRTCDLARPTVTLSNVSSTGKIKVSWTKVEGAVKYEVYRATSKNGTYTKLITTTKTSITNTSAKAGKTYYYKVKAIAEKSAANSAYSSITSRMCDLARPTVSVARNSKGKPVVSWKAVTGAVKYKVYIYNSDGELVKTSTTTKLKLTHSSAVKGSTYTYRVMAVHSSSSANSAKSTAVKIKSK